MRNIKSKIRIILILLGIAFTFFVSQSFAAYLTSVGDVLGSNDNTINFAGFVKNNQLVNNLSFQIDDFNPGDTKEIGFSVSNFLTRANNQNIYSDVTINYNIVINSYALPLNYSLKDSNNNVIPLTCNGYVNIQCNTGDLVMPYDTMKVNNYVLTVTFPETYENQSYYYNFANNIDDVILQINSRQA